MSHSKQKAARTVPGPVQTEPIMDHETLLKSVKELANTIDEYLEKYPPEKDSRTPSAEPVKVQGTTQSQLRPEPIRNIVQRQATPEPLPLARETLRTSPQAEVPAKITSEPAEKRPTAKPRLEFSTVRQPKTDLQEPDLFDQDFIAL